MAKKNGKFVVATILLGVLAMSLIALFVQTQINANRGKEPPVRVPPEEAPADAGGGS